MSYFNRSNNWIIGMLVLLNIGLLAGYWLQFYNNSGSKKMLGVEDRKKIVLNHFETKLGLSDTQIKAFEKERNSHFEKAASYSRIDKQLHREMFAALGKTPPDSNRAKEIAEEISTNRQKIEENLITHYLTLLEICDSDQKEKLGNIFLEAMQGVGNTKPEGRFTGE